MAKLLIVEDDPVVVELLQKYLSEHQLSIASSGAEATAQMNADFDLVVLDLGLPDMDGIEVCRWLHRRYPQTAILVLTAKSDSATCIRALYQGADDFIGKPLRKEEFTARVFALLRRSKPLAKEKGMAQKLIN